MSFLYFDCFSGISGDMALGALLDCGVPIEALREGLASLPVEGWHIEAEPTLISGIHAMNVTISLHGVTDADELIAAGSQQLTDSETHTHPHEHHADGHSHDHEHSHAHEHDEHEHSHEHEHHHSHDHSHEHEHHHEDEHTHEHHSHEHHHGRSMAEIREVIVGSTLSDGVKATSLAIFEKIAQAEAEMHHTTLDEVHFHEIGGVDSLLDICGVAWCLEYLGVNEVHCSALPLSSGFVDCAHGRMPVPAPATLKILQGVPLYPTDVKGELITPTGAAIVATLAQSFGAPPGFTPRAVGHGAGKKRFADRPNMLRAVVGERVSSPASGDGLDWQSLRVIECNIDDMNPELFDYVMARLFEAGALDVWLQNAQMKKNRPATILHALCAPDSQDKLIAILLRETTTLGVRVREVRRAALPREVRQVETPFGSVSVKVARWPEQGLWRAVPEYDDVVRLASQRGVAAHAVYEAAQRAARDEETKTDAA